MALSNIAGFPRIGPERELKFATEGYWRGEISLDELLEVAKRIRLDNWRFMQSAGIDLIPSNDFSLYDQVLDTIALVGAVPDRYGHGRGPVDLDTYFAMARGRQESGVDVTAMEMTKWFDTNYHYIVPELGPDTSFSLSSTKPFDEHAEAMEELGIDTVPVIVGPVSFLLLGKSADGVPEDFDRLGLIEPLLEVYGELIERLAEQGATWVQLDEPCFVEDRSERELDALRLAYEELARVHERTRICVKTYFDHVGDAYGVLRDLPIEGIGLDLHREGADVGGAMEREGPKNVELIADDGGLEDKWLFAGIVNGRNVWINELEHSLDLLGGLRDRCAELVVTTSCSLLHTPLDLDAEPTVGRSGRRAALLDGVRQAEGGRGRNPGSRPGGGARGDRGRARRQRPGARGPADLRAHPNPGGAGAGGGADRAGRAPPEPLRGSPRGSARPPRAAALPDHHDRLLSPDLRDPRSARLASPGEDRRGHLPGPDALRGRARDRLSGGGRPRRARPWRAGAQRHGPVLRRADGGLRLHPERLGAVIRLPLRAARRSCSATSAGPRR